MKVTQQAAALVDHANQTLTAAEILLVELHVLSQFADAGDQDGDLHFHRADIAFGTLELIDNLLLLLFVHFLSFLLWVISRNSCHQTGSGKTFPLPTSQSR